MFTSTPQPPSLTWTTTNTSNTIPTNLMPSATVSSTAQSYTPSDVANYLGRMDYTRTWTSMGDMWKHKDNSGYMTWEQAVVYCLVKPWLSGE